MLMYRNTDALIVNTKTPSFKLCFFTNILKMKCIIADDQK